MKSFSVAILASILIAGAQAVLGDKADVLMMGDSFLDFSGESGAKNKINAYCAGKKFKNRAISGSTAV